MKDKYLQLIRKFYLENHRLPTFVEMKELFNLASTNSIFRYVQHWIKEGLLEKKGKIISITSNFLALPLVGSIRAGYPDMPMEDVVEKININDFLVKNFEDTFLVRVTGDSMVDEGIKKDDIVIVNKKINPKRGDIVVACIDGQWTLKYFEKTNGQIFLRAGNGRYENLFPRESLIIAGVITGVVRKYMSGT